MKKNNKIIEYKKDSIFRKIAHILKKIWFKNKYTKTSIIYKENDIKKEKKSEFLNSITIKNRGEVNNKKEEFFKYYNDFKNEKISAEEIPAGMLLKINKMLDEELKIKMNDYNSLEKLIIEDDLNK